MQRFAIIDAPSILGLRPTGVEYLPEAVKAAGLLKRLDAEYAGKVSTLEYDSKRDEETLLLNPEAIRHYSKQLANAVTNVLQRKRFPIVLGGDCSILIGNLLALRRLGRYGLFFMDGHADFYQPEASPTGEVADMDLAIVSGRGPDILTSIDYLKPFVRDEDIVLFGNRDSEQAKNYGSQDVSETDIHIFDFEKVQKLGITAAASQAIGKLMKSELEGFWIHLDVDVLNYKAMPAVDYRLSGGIGYEDLSQLLQILLASGKAVGMNITIFNPKLDSDGSIAHRLVSSLVAGLSDLKR
ncbi:MAG TPA: arginase family protein [Nitrososphaera sp.]|jgi:arginase|nr:arginase family protein [Nitrososphaera sp.]